MASNDVEVLDPAATVEKLKKFASERVLNRRHFIAAMGVAGAAAGTELVSGSRVFAQQPLSNGYNQIDVLNLMLNIRYLKATLYSYVTQGVDLPPASQVTVGTGGVFNAPGKITFSNQQITDLFNEMYYDDLNQLIALRSLLGTAAANRQTINLLGTGTVTATTTTLTQSQAVALARMLEDLSVTALAGASIYLSGANLNYAMQAMAVDGFHAGAIRLIAIQTGAEYLSTQTASTATTSAATPITFTGATTTGSNTIYSFLNASPNLPVVGQVVSGIGLPPGAGAVITAITNTASKTPTGITVKGSNVINTVSSLTGLAPGQPITGTNIPANSYIQSLGTNTITIFANVNGVPVASNATASTTVAPTGILTSGNPIINNVSSVSGVIVGQPITGTGVPSGATVQAVSASTASPLTITMSGNATASPVVTPTGVVTNGSNLVQALSSITGLIVGQPITGSGIAASTTITAVGTTTLSLSAPATGSTATTATFTGFATSGSATIASVSSVTGLVVGQLISDSQGNIPGQTTITAIGKATFNAITTSASNLLTAVSSIAALAVGQVLTGTGIPTGATITAVVAGTITMSVAATATITNPEAVTSAVANAITLSSVAQGTSATADTFSVTTGVKLTSPTTVAVTIPTTETITVGQSQVIIAGNATFTGVNTLGVLLADNFDVEPGDPGTIYFSGILTSGSLSVTGVSSLTGLAVGQLVTGPNIATGTTIATISSPSTITLSAQATGGAITPVNLAAYLANSATLAGGGPSPLAGISPSIYQGFFNTAASGTSSANNPPGFVFARSFQQVLQVLLNSNSTTYPTTTVQNYEGGFYPVGVSGNINSTI